MRWASLWKGPNLCDTVPCTGSWGEVYSTWGSMGLYALDTKGRAWTLCRNESKPVTRWILVDDLVSGAAARQWHAEQESA